MTELESSRALIAGCGDLGGRVGRLLVAAGAAVWGLRRSADRLPSGLLPVAADLTDQSSLERALGDHNGKPWAAGQGPQVVIYSAAASRFDDDAYRAAYVSGLENLLAVLGRSGNLPQRLIFVSSTSVYGQTDGMPVDEDSPAEGAGFGAKRLRQGEQLVLESGIPEVTRVRLGGIYGPQRTRLLDTVRQGQAVCYDQPPIWTNRIHVDDCARGLAHLVTLEDLADLYVGVDDEPSLDGDVKRWLADRLGVEEPPVATIPPSVGSRRMRSNKRCSNARLKASGFEFLYADFRQGYGAILDTM